GGGEGWNSPVSTGTSSPGGVTALVYTHQYTLSIAALPSGSGGVLPASGWENAGATVAISATANAGYAFNGWTATGSIAITTPSSQATFATMNSPGTVEANFIPSVIITGPSAAQVVQGLSTSFVFTITGAPQLVA